MTRAADSETAAAVRVSETEHARLRRRQRGIDTQDFESALANGTWQPYRHDFRKRLYSYNGIFYLVRVTKKRKNLVLETCYPAPLHLKLVKINEDARAAHEKATKRLQLNLNSWTSNSVIIVDTSGSMKAADMWGTRNRLGAVWVSVALDFLAHRLESGAAGPTDVLSIVTLEKEPRIIISEQPCTWVLYNTIALTYSQNRIPPCGHGPFLPSLEVAETLLTRNPNASCAMALTFLSDGRPSDCGRLPQDEWGARIARRVGNLAQKFGRRLSFTAIGVGDYSQFDLLERMVEEAKDYGAIGLFALPSMTSASLGDIFTSVATSLTTTQTEMTDVISMQQRQVRDVERESRKKASQPILTVTEEDFDIYRASCVERFVYSEWYEGREKKTSFDPAPLQNSTAEYVALSKEAFGEGAEQFAFRFYELSTDGKTIVGNPMVAKESRLILDVEEGAGVGIEAAWRKFVRTFCSTQQLARRLALEFNQKLDETRRVDPRTPRVSFLDCSVYELHDKNKGKLSVLVEDKLDHTKWKKWNANNGWTEGMEKAPEFDRVALREEFAKVDAGDLMNIVEEGSDEEPEEDDEACESRPKVEAKVFSPSEVAQAFSHFTYWASGRKRLVCDLQGVYDEGNRLLKFSDPVIHYHHPGRPDERRFVHGKTDRGRDGVAMFFDTHNRDHCGHLCLLMIRGFRRPRHHQQPLPSAKPKEAPMRRHHNSAENQG